MANRANKYKISAKKYLRKISGADESDEECERECKGKPTEEPVNIDDIKIEELKVSLPAFIEKRSEESDLIVDSETGKEKCDWVLERSDSDLSEVLDHDDIQLMITTGESSDEGKEKNIFTDEGEEEKEKEEEN